MMKKKWDVDYTTSLASISLANQHEREWYNDFRYSLADHLDVPRSKQEEIRRQHQSVNASFSRYCVSSLPGFSWARLAGALYCSEEESALVAAKRYIKREEGMFSLNSCSLANQLKIYIMEFYLIACWYSNRCV